MINSSLRSSKFDVKNIAVSFEVANPPKSLNDSPIASNWWGFTARTVLLHGCKNLVKALANMTFVMDCCGSQRNPVRVSGMQHRRWWLGNPALPSHRMRCMLWHEFRQSCFD